MQTAQSVKVIITGATGMVGEGVLQICLRHPQITDVLVINRKPCGVEHAKLKEVIHADFYDLGAVEEQLRGYNACFFCLGISSVGVSREEYYKTTYTLTMHMGETLSRLNPDMVFDYISGGGTDSSEQGRLYWARVKGKTENDLRRLPFRRAFAVRPGFIKPFEGLKRVHPFYKYIAWLFPIGRVLYPNGFCTMEELALAMIHTVTQGYEQDILQGRDIIVLARRTGG